MFDSELVGICYALARSNRRNVVLSNEPDFKIFASGYNSALVDVLEAISCPEEAQKLLRLGTKTLSDNIFSLQNE